MPSLVKNEHLKAIKRVLLYISQHPDEKLSLAILAKIARISEFHFHRIFQAYLGVSLKQYINRTRMEKALYALHYKQKSMTDIAFDCGFETPSSFNKAFRKTYNTHPSDVKQSVGHKKRNFMQYLNQHKIPLTRMETLPNTQIFYIRKLGNYNQSAHAAWTCMFQTLKMQQQQGEQDLQFFGISHDNPHAEGVNEEDLRFDACVHGKKDLLTALAKNTEGALAEIPAGNYAIFTFVGPYENLGSAYHYIYGEWLSTSGMQLRDSSTFIRYLDLADDQVPWEKKTSEIYLPVI